MYLISLQFITDILL